MAHAGAEVNAGSMGYPLENAYPRRFAFAAIDIPSGGQPRTQMAKITVRIGPPITGWALVTVTDNVTQQVTAYWPQ